LAAFQISSGTTASTSEVTHSWAGFRFQPLPSPRPAELGRCLALLEPSGDRYPALCPRSAQLRRTALGGRHPRPAGSWRPGCSRKTIDSCVFGLPWGIDLSRHGRTGKRTRQSKEAVIGRRVIRDPLIHAQDQSGNNLQEHHEYLAFRNRLRPSWFKSHT
jgi:hypothetical protein